MDLNNDEVLKAIIIWEQRRRLAVISVISYVVSYLIHRRRQCKNRVDRCSTKATIERQKVHDELMNQLGTSEKEVGSTPSRAHSHEPSSKGKKRRFDGKDDVVKAIQEMTEVIRESNAILARSLPPRVISENHIFAALDEMGFERQMLTKAYIFLVRNPPMMRTFFDCPVTKRKDLLLEMMISSKD